MVEIPIRWFARPVLLPLSMKVANFEFLSVTGCLLCDELDGNSPPSARIGPRAQTLLESELFVLLPDISPLIPGHCLLIPKQHHCSLATLPHDHIERLSSFLHDCTTFVSRRSFAPLLFEHGSGPLAPKSGACIHHAHLHLLPVTAPVVKWLRPFGKVHELRTKTPYESAEPSDLGDYLAYRNQHREWFLVSELEERPPCQFLRRRIAQHFNLPEWHWESVFISKLPFAASECPRSFDNYR